MYSIGIAWLFFIHVGGLNLAYSTAIVFIALNVYLTKVSDSLNSNKANGMCLIPLKPGKKPITALQGVAYVPPT